MTLLDEAKVHLDALGAANRAFMQTYPGDRAARQPVHTVYGGAQLFKAETTPRLGARGARERWTPTAARLGRDVVARAACGCTSATRSPSGWLARAPSTSACGASSSASRSRTSASTSRTASAPAPTPRRTRPRSPPRARWRGACGDGTLPPFVGIRIKSFGEEWKRARRAHARALPRHPARRDRRPPARQLRGHAAQGHGCRAAADAGAPVRAARAPPRPGAGTLRLELMIEMTQALIGADGRSPLPGFLAACEGRCVAAHFGTYDYTASCNVTAAYQTMDHPVVRPRQGHA